LEVDGPQDGFIRGELPETITISKLGKQKIYFNVHCRKLVPLTRPLFEQMKRSH